MSCTSKSWILSKLNLCLIKKKRTFAGGAIRIHLFLFTLIFSGMSVFTIFKTSKSLFLYMKLGMSMSVIST